MVTIAQTQARAMDRMYRHQRHIYDLSRRYYLLGRDELIECLDPPNGAHVLEVGCGTGRNLVTAATRHPDARFYGLDISGEMLKSADAAIARARLDTRVMLGLGDATSFDPRFVFRQVRFDRIYFSYTLSMIPDWRKAIARAVNLLAPGGELHIVDFGQCERLPGLVRKGLFAWLKLFGVSPCGDLERELRAGDATRELTFTFTPLYRGYAWHAVAEKPSQPRTASSAGMAA
jgi:S-adenosylmethionine-diacylgycerolhomoserine-N-methlytransferase